MKKAVFFLRKRKILVILILILIGALYFLKFHTQNGSTPEYQTATVEKGSIVSSITASGTILTSNSSVVTTQASGTVSKVYIKDKEEVKKGQVIAKIELDADGLQNQSQAYASYLSAKNSLAQARTNYYTLQSAMFVANQKFIHGAAQSNLPTDDPVYIEQNADWLASEQNFINNQVNIDKAKASLSNAYYTYQQSRSEIVAPVSGTLSSLSIAEGMSLSASFGTSGSTSNQTIANISSEGTPLATFNVSEIDVPNIKVGQKATITLDSITDKTFTGEIVSINRVGSTSSNVTTYPVIIKFDTSSGQILSKMAATANIITATKNNVLTIPSVALQTQGGTTSVRVLKNGIVQNVTVETGISSDTNVEVTSGLSEGETVITGTNNSSATSGGSANTQRSGGLFSVPGGGGGRFVGR